MAGHCTHGQYFYSPSARKSTSALLVQYPAIFYSGTVRLGPQLRSSSIGMVSDCLFGAPAAILRGFFFDNFIFKAPPPGVN